MGNSIGSYHEPFKVGDRIKCVDVDGYHGLGTVTAVHSNGAVQCLKRDDVGSEWSTLTGGDYHPGIIKIIKVNMSIKENFALFLTPEPQKTFRKLGITNGDNLLTSEGSIIFLTWLLGKNQDTFKTEVCDAMLAEQEKNK